MEPRVLENMSPELQRVAARARNYPQERLQSLAHHIDVEALRRAYGSIRRDAAVGVDGVTWQAYGEKLEENLQDLHRRLKEMRYRHQPIRRVLIPKEGGRQRPIGVSTIEDKIVQEALRKVLEAIYEQDFLECSYGFRPGRKAHEAVRQLDHAIHTKGQPWILEFDIQSYFDNVDRSALKGMLQERIADKSLMRLIGKCLHVGILEGEEYSIPEVGTVQGSVLSPVVGNIYLHYVLDLWIENEVKPRLRGQMSFVRFADDGVFTFEKREDAERVRDVLGKRLARFGLRLNLEKTRLVDFRKPATSQTRGKAAGTFDFLGFTLYWCRSRAGRWVLQAKTRRGRLKRATNAIYDWCRRHRHQPVEVQHAALMRRLRGHFNYFGVKGNSGSIDRLIGGTKRAWYKWLNRRSQRSRLTQERFRELLVDYPLHLPALSISLWGQTL